MDADKFIFEKIEIDTVSDAVVNQIEQLIISGVLKSGEKLPSERELAELMNVSRPKIRDAIKVLEERGLLMVKHGGGTFIGELTGTALSPAMLDLFSRHASAFYDYLEFRREVEGFAAYLAARRATESDLTVIRKILKQMEKAHEAGDSLREAEIDATFHAAIVDTAHNTVLVHMMSSIYALMQRGVFYNREFIYNHNNGRARLLEQHRAIAEAVLAKDPDRACKAAEAHMDFVRSSFRLASAADSRQRIASKRLRLFETSEPPPYRRRKLSPA